MGSPQSKNIVTKTDAEINENVSNSSAVTDIEHISQKEIHLEFIKLYAHSRTALHIATAASNGKLHHNIVPSLQWNLKSLNECCNRFETYSKGIEDLVTERLEAATDHGYTVPNTDSGSINSYINSRNSARCDAPRPPPPPSHVQGNGLQSNDSLETGADVM